MPSRWIAAALAAAPAVSAAAQAPFEGTVTYQIVSHERPPVTMTSSVKGTKARTEMQRDGRSVTIINDRASGTTMSLMPERKMYLVMNLGAMRDAMAGRGDGPPAGDRGASITATGRRETIAGIPCEHYLGTSARRNTRMDFCIAKGMGTFMGLPGGAGPPGPRGPGPGDSPEAAEFLRTFKDGAFVLKLEATVDGEVVTRMEATKVERKSLGDDLFAPPAGWTAFDPTQLRRGRP